MKKTRSLHLLAALAIAPLSANAFVSPHSAKGNTAFIDQNDPAGADPNAKKGGSYISDGGMQNAVGAGTAKTAAIIGGSFSGVRNSGEIDGGRDLGASEHDSAGIGLGLNTVPVAAAGRQAYLQ